MCSCMESCYWHLIEKRFCFDESIALYEEPEKEEKNNNMFDNMAFYDSVSVIAGRAIVTIDPLPEAKPIIQQPIRRLIKPEKIEPEEKIEVPLIIDEAPSKVASDDDEEQHKDEVDNITLLDIKVLKKNASTNDIPEAIGKLQEQTTEKISQSTGNLLEPPDIQLRKKSLRERRMSKSLYLKLDLPKEIPIIRQHSMPKFYLDTPEDNQTESTLIKHQSTALTSPLTRSSGFIFDLYSVVQMEKARHQNVQHPPPPAPIHRESSRLALIKEKIKLRKTKSNLSSTSIPHSNYI